MEHLSSNMEAISRCSEIYGPPVAVDRPMDWSSGSDFKRPWMELSHPYACRILFEAIKLYADDPIVGAGGWLQGSLPYQEDVEFERGDGVSVQILCDKDGSVLGWSYTVTGIPLSELPEGEESDSEESGFEAATHYEGIYYVLPNEPQGGV